MGQKIAIIGGGIVGSTVAYYLSQNEFRDYDVALFDEGNGQATKAAAGIISPWLSKRRNQKWYHLAVSGAELIAQLAQETQMNSRTYSNDGTIITRKNNDDLAALYQIALARKQAAPQIGEVRYVSNSEIKDLIPLLSNSPYRGLYVPGGSRIDGNLYCQHLLNIALKVNLKFYQGHVSLISDHKLKFKNDIFTFDKIILATGAWSKQILADLNINLQLRPQKGQLIEIQVPTNNLKNHMPVMMPESEYDFIPIGKDKLIIGATHDNDQGFDLKAEISVNAALVKTANHLIGNVSTNNITLSRVGTRAYTNDFSPVFGRIPNHPDLFLGTGLGSSGLTTGPMVAKLLVNLIKDKPVNFDEYQKPMSNYIK